MSREVYGRLLEQLDCRDPSALTASELSQVLNTTGRLGGLAIGDVEGCEVTVRIVNVHSPSLKNIVFSGVCFFLRSLPRKVRWSLSAPFRS